MTNFNIGSWSPGGLDRVELINLVNSNRVVNVSGFNANATNSNSGATDISTGVRSHVYVATGYNASTGRFSLRNPWGTRHLSLTFNQVLLLLVAARIAILLPLPAGIGTLESSQVLGLGVLGLETAVGISISLVIRARDVLLGLFGLWWGWRQLAERKPS